MGKKESIGSFSLLNPGNDNPSDFCILEEGKVERHKVGIDPTMRQMVKLVERIYNTNELSNRFYIYNLFSLRNPKNVDAISNFEQVVLDNVIKH